MTNEIMYLCGILDGEGWFSIRRTKKNGELSASYMPSIGVANTDVRLMNWLKENFGGTIAKVNNFSTSLGTRQRYEWRLRVAEARELLPKIIPKLLLKGEQAKLLLEISNLHSTSYRGKGVPSEVREKREEYYIALRKLNNTFHKIEAL